MAGVNLDITERKRAEEPLPLGTELTAGCVAGSLRLHLLRTTVRISMVVVARMPPIRRVVGLGGA